MHGLLYSLCPSPKRSKELVLFLETELPESSLAPVFRPAGLWPDRLVCLPSLPVLPSLKIDRVALRRLANDPSLLEGYSAGSSISVPTLTEDLPDLAALIAEVLELPSLDHLNLAASNFLELGADSFRFFSLVWQSFFIADYFSKALLSYTNSNHVHDSTFPSFSPTIDNSTPVTSARY